MKRIPKNIGNEDLLWIRGFTSITISGVCKKLKIDRSYLVGGYYPEEKYKLVRKEIEKEIAKLYLK